MISFLSVLPSRRAWSLLALALAAMAARAQVPVVAGTLPEDSLPGLKSLLTAALSQSPQMVGREIDVTLSEAYRYGSSAQQLPSIGGGATFGGTNVQTAGSPTNKSNGLYYNLGITQPIFAWNALKNQTAIADIGIQISKRNYAEAYRALAGSIRTQYLSLIQRNVSLRLQRYNLKLAESYLAIDEEKLKSGALSTAGILVPRMNIDDARLSMARTDEDFGNGCRLLARMCGVDSLAEDSIPFEMPQWTGTNEAATALLALYDRDGVERTLPGQVLALNLRREDLNYAIAKVRLYPKINATAGVAQSNNTEVGPGFVRQTASFSTNYGIGAAWTIFDGFAAKGSKLAALANKRSYEQQRKVLTTSIHDQAQNLVRTVGFSRRYLDLAESRRAAAEAILGQTKKELALGDVAQTSVDAAVVGLYGNDLAVAAGRYDLLTRWVELVSLVGADPVLDQLPARYVH